MDTIQELINKIQNEKLLSATIFLGCDLDEILDVRDSESFEKDWLQCFKKIKNKLEKSPLTKPQIDLIDKLREVSFMAVSNATKQHEIASYISDDFELISKAALLGGSFEYAENLLNVYLAGELPC